MPPPMNVRVKDVASCRLGAARERPVSRLDVLTDYKLQDNQRRDCPVEQDLGSGVSGWLVGNSHKQLPRLRVPSYLAAYATILIQDKPICRPPRAFAVRPQFDLG